MSVCSQTFFTMIKQSFVTDISDKKNQELLTILFYFKSHLRFHFVTVIMAIYATLDMLQIEMTLCQSKLEAYAWSVIKLKDVFKIKLRSFNKFRIHNINGLKNFCSQ